MKKNWSVIGGSLLALAAASAVWANRRWFLVHDITTGENAAYPELRSRVYYAEVEQAMAAAEQALKRLPQWHLLSRDSENDILEAEVQAPIRALAHEVTLYFFGLGHGQSRVTVRSRSRFGDLGSNARCIRQLQQAMDARLNTDAAF